ncbi:MAG: CPBP family intramembrane metalloprotease [Clostridiales bacterium]|nr:CPBP family intramembrane metalloprotease [Clostridiales bacterium]
MNYKPEESSRKPKVFPVRLRTFLVPLFGAALYYGGLIIIMVVAMFSLGDNYEKYTHSIHAVAMLVLLPATIVWIILSEQLEGKRIYRRSITPAKALSAFVIALGLLGVTMAYFFLLESLSSISFIRESLEQYESLVSVEVEMVLFEKIVYVILLTIFVPIVEELIFRGIILHEFLSTMKPGVAVVLTATVFAVIHIQPIQVGYAFFCGLVISVVYVLSRSIYLTIVLHGAYNFFGSVLQVIFPQAEEWADVLALVYLVSIALGVIAVIYLKKEHLNNISVEENNAASFDG